MVKTKNNTTPQLRPRDKFHLLGISEGLGARHGLASGQAKPALTADCTTVVVISNCFPGSRDTMSMPPSEIRLAEAHLFANRIKCRLPAPPDSEKGKGGATM